MRSAYRHSRESGNPASDESKSLGFVSRESSGVQTDWGGENLWPDLKILTRFFLDFAQGWPQNIRVRNIYTQHV